MLTTVIHVSYDECMTHHFMHSYQFNLLKWDAPPEQLLNQNQMQNNTEFFTLYNLSPSI